MWIGICKLVDIPEKQGENVTYWKNHCGESWKWEEARGGGVWRRAQTLVVRVTSPRDPPLQPGGICHLPLGSGLHRGGGGAVTL